MICRVCKEEIDDRFTKCPFCGATVGNEGAQQPQQQYAQYPQYQQPAQPQYTAQSGRNIRVDDGTLSNSSEYQDVRSGRPIGQKSNVFDDGSYDDEDKSEYAEYDDDDYVPVKRNKFKLIVGGIAIGVVVFAIGLICILYFSGALGNKPEETTVATTVATTAATTEATTKPVTTTETTTEGTTVPASTVLDSDGNPLPDIYFETIKTVKVKVSSGLNLRKGPGTTYGKVKLLDDKTEVKVIGKSVTISDWLYVSYEKDNVKGWAKADYLDGAESIVSTTESDTEENTTAPETTSAVSATTTTTKAVTTTAKPTTTEPSTDAKDVEAPDTRYETKEKAYVKTDSGLNLRKSPSSEGGKIKVLNKNTELTKIGKNDDNADWVYVYCASTGDYGWVAAKYLSDSKSN